MSECVVVRPMQELGAAEACLAVSLRRREERNLREPPASRDLKVDLVGGREEKVLPLVCLHVHRRVDRRAELGGEGLSLPFLLRRVFGLWIESHARQAQ